MISWNDLSKILERSKGVYLKDLEFQTCSDSIPHYTVVTAATVTASVAPATVEKADTYLLQMITAPPAVPAAPPAVHVAAVVAAAVAEKRPLSLTAAKHAIDPVVIGISLVDPLYEGSPYNTRHNIEKEVAVKLEGQLDVLYKSNSGRSRGWTKVGLEAMIKPRCASGGDLKELDRAKKPFLWSLAHEDKALSAFLDFVCCARRIHVVLMDTEKRMGYLYPAADILADDDGKPPSEYPLFLVSNTGFPLFGIRNSAELLEFVDKNGWNLVPPHSVTHSLSGLKLDELESVGKRLGMSTVEGSKAERVTAIAAHKTRTRLAAH